MSGPDLEIRMLTAHPRTEQVPRSHLSLELGHLYMEDLVGGVASLRRHFKTIKPWADFVQAQAGPKRRVSTCFLVDEYFSQVVSPKTLVPELVEASTAEGLTIDYLTRESACASADGFSPAELVLARIVPDPPPGTNGLRPPPHESGWLANAQGMARTADLNDEAFGSAVSDWAPPKQNGVRGHSICMDVQLWDDHRGRRRWSCAYLSAVWQLLRLGVLRYEGRALVEQQTWHGTSYPNHWGDLPSILRLNPHAQPFCAFQTITILETRFADVEAAVRMILSQVTVDPAVAAQIIGQAESQGVRLPTDLVRRVSHVFSDGL